MTSDIESQLFELNLPTFMLVDGALSPDVNDRLLTYGLQGRPVFRETAGRDLQTSGPWLVSLRKDRSLTSAAVSFAAVWGKAVFWLGECDEATILRHLRKINAARISDGRIVYFRHYDADVLAFLIPLLDAEQASILFGPMSALAFMGGCGSGCTVTKPVGLPITEKSLIEFNNSQILELNRRQSGLSREKIWEIIRMEVPHQVGTREDIERQCNECLGLGMSNEASHLRWCLLNQNRDCRLRNLFVSRLDRDGTEDQQLKVFFANHSKDIQFVGRIEDYFT